MSVSNSSKLDNTLALTCIRGGRAVVGGVVVGCGVGVVGSGRVGWGVGGRGWGGGWGSPRHILCGRCI